MTYIDCFLIVCLLIKEKPLSYLRITHKKMRKLLSKNVERAIHYQLTLMWKSTQSFQQTKRRSWAAKKTHKIDLFSCHLLQEGVCVKHALDNGDANTMIVQQLLNKAAKKECSCSLYWYWRIFCPFATFWYKWKFKSHNNKTRTFLYWKSCICFRWWLETMFID